MSPQSVRNAFRKAGFPLTNGRRGNRCWQYRSSTVYVRFIIPFYECNKPELTVWIGKRRGEEFESAIQAITYLQRIQSISLVSDNEFCLRKPGGYPSLELIIGGAA